MKKVENCPICDSKNISENTRKESIRDRHENVYEIEDYTFTVCGECSFEFVTAAQGRKNDRLLEDARREAAELLTSGEIRAIRAKYKLRQEDASILFGGGKNAFSKYEQGYVSQSISMDRLLRVADKFPEVVSHLQQMTGLVTTVPIMKLVGTKSEVRYRDILTQSFTRGLLGLLDIEDHVLDVRSIPVERKWSDKKLRAIGLPGSNDEVWIDDRRACNG